MGLLFSKFENYCGLADGHMLGYDSSGILDGHKKAAEFNDFCT